MYKYNVWYFLLKDTQVWYIISISGLSVSLSLSLHPTPTALLFKLKPQSGPFNRSNIMVRQALTNCQQYNHSWQGQSFTMKILPSFHWTHWFIAVFRAAQQRTLISAAQTISQSQPRSQISCTWKMRQYLYNVKGAQWMIHTVPTTCLFGKHSYSGALATCLSAYCDDAPITLGLGLSTYRMIPTVQ